MNFVWISVKDRKVFREFPRKMLAHLAARLYAPQLWMLQRRDAKIVTTEAVADTLCRYAWSELGENVFLVTPVDVGDTTMPGTCEAFGIPVRVGEKLDRFAEQQAMLSAAQAKEALPTTMPETWEHFTAPGDDILRAYYRARVNNVLLGIHIGHTIVKVSGTPEA